MAVEESDSSLVGHKLGHIALGASIAGVEGDSQWLPVAVSELFARQPKRAFTCCCCCSDRCWTRLSC